MLEMGSFSRMLALVGLVGIVSGLGTVLFYWILDLSSHFFQDYLMGYRPMLPAGEESLYEHSSTVFNPYLFFVIPALGGLLSGILVFWLAPEAEGHGTDLDGRHPSRGRADRAKRTETTGYCAVARAEADHVRL